jgi:hypothetical protein
LSPVYRAVWSGNRSVWAVYRSVWVCNFLFSFFFKLLYV